MTDRRAELLLVLSTILAAGGWVFSKESLAEMPTFAFLGSRFFLASLILLAFCHKDLMKASRDDLRKALGCGFLLATAILLWIYSLSVSDTLGEGAFIMSLTMLFAPFIGWLLFKQPPSASFWIALPVALVGLGFLSLANGWVLANSQVWFLASAFTFAFQFNIVSRVAKTLPTMLLTCIQLFVTGVIGLSLSLLFEDVPTSISPNIWVWFAMSIILSTCLRFACLTRGLKGTTAINAAFIMILEPVFTVIFSVLWYSEPMPPQKVIGCLLILTALIGYRGGFSWIGKRVLETRES
ncbi:DMT family transporter [Enterovibrio sp. ZSDZ35]|uniref:DMT family transporter n=1 Tax=Enterovibrio qingdaonensis TaxID=2899818 RepID=A0ABT5QKD4_9GAMM|nr:DMT family transporter [Enterovibrio sp. ZSDZ35]MDD1781064.1 DMT family transporter [Enterovibrio sp. ZSDZ35]